MRMTYRRYSINSLCGLFGNSRQAYYDRRSYLYRCCLEEDAVVSQVRELRRDFPRMGVRKLQVYLGPRFAKLGITVSRDRLFTLLEAHGLLVRRVRSKRKTTWSDHWMHKYPNLIRGYMPTSPNQLWVSDITYIECSGAFRYLSLVTDAYSHKIVGWNIAGSLNSINALRALEMALRTLPKGHSGLIHHSDRGIQYCSTDYVQKLREHHISISMTESGDPLENAVAERINGILKTEWLYVMDIASPQALKSCVSRIIELYNDERPHQSIDYLTPSYVHATGTVVSRKWKNYYKSDREKKNSVSLLSDSSACQALSGSEDVTVRSCQAISGLKRVNSESVKLCQDYKKNKVENCKVITGRD
ncbi:IS3 family transposase, partial [Bacteroides timonensis]|uniref:IS3 family transposase n=1 Tax=Bacteroides timonensis TaxID=1470345 RepID=UPI000942CD94